MSFDKIINQPTFSIMRPITYTFIFCLSLMSAQASRIHVTISGNGTKSGNSWANAREGAYQLNTIISNANVGDSIFVAEGKYLPSSSITVTAAINLKAGISLFGGFPQSNVNLPSPTWANRNVNLYPTVLSGDIENNDWDSDNDPYYQLTDDIIGSNSNNVVIVPAGASNIILDGFIISGGDAKTGNGGGIYQDYNAAITIRNCFIVGNKGTQGGGIYNYVTGANSQVVACVIFGNAANDGGGVYNHANAKTNFKKCTFSTNTANNNGGAIANNYSSVIVISNSAISSNIAPNGAGIYNYTSSINCANNVIVENNGTSGAGIYNYNASPLITNTTIAGNYAISNGGGVANLGNSSPKIKNSILARNTATDMWNGSTYTPLVSNSIITVYNSNSCSNCPGNFGHEDPQFINAQDADGADDIWMTNDDGLRLKPCSAAINAGNNSAVPTYISADAQDLIRIQQNTVDLGAYEMLTFEGGGYNSTANAANQNIIANEECLDASGWTHYYNTDQKKIILSLKKNGYDIGSINDGVFNVSIHTTNKYGTGQGTIINAPYTEDKDFVSMNRWWNVIPHPQLPLGNTGVKVRTYFTDADTADVNGTLSGIQNDVAITQLHFYKINDFNTSLNPDGNNETADAHTGVTAAASYNEPGYWGYNYGQTSSTETWSLGAFNGVKYAEYEIAKFSGGGGGFSGTKGQIFPVELLSFDVVERNGANRAVWTTTKEENTHKFDVERSVDGYSYELIGAVMAAGNSSDKKNYDFTDFNVPEGYVYYRLRMIDNDGKFSFSNVVTVGNVKNSYTIYPNPATSILFLDGEVFRNGTILVSNAMGQLMSEIVMGNTPNPHIDITQWERGFYVLQIFDEMQQPIGTHKLIVK